MSRPKNRTYLSLILIVFISAFCCQELKGQAKYEGLLHKSFAERIHQLKALIDESVIRNRDSAIAYKEIAKFKDFAISHDDEELILEADLWVCYYNVWHRRKNTGLVVGSLETMISKANDEGAFIIEARARALLANYYFRDKNYYERSFEEYFKLEELLDKIPAEEFPDKLVINYLISELYFYFGDYPEAIAYCKKALKIKPVSINLGSFNSARNLIGLSYQLMGNLDSSDYHLRQLLDKKSPTYMPVFDAIGRGNLGYNFYLRGEYKAAIPLLEADINAAIKIQDWGLAAGSLIPLAAINLKLGAFKKTETLIKQAKAYIEESKQYKRYAELYPLMSKFYASKGNLSLSNRYLDSTLIVKDSLSKKFNALLMFRTQQKFALQQYRLEVSKMDSEKKVKTLQRNLLLVVLLSLVILSVYIYFNQKKRHRQLAIIAELELHSKTQKLTDATQQLRDFADDIVNKNRQIELLEKESGTIDNNTNIEQMRKLTIITDDGWTKFRDVFSRVHIGYFQRLKEKMPDLTPAEVRFMALNKLQLNNKEMASVLGISTQSVRNIRSRLFKKLSVSDQKSFDERISEV